MDGGMDGGRDGWMERGRREGGKDGGFCTFKVKVNSIFRVINCVK